MMEDHEFCDSCAGCRPALLDPKTGKKVPDIDPMMAIIDRVWDQETSFAQRKSYIEVTLKNSRHAHDLKLFQQVCKKIQTALKEIQ